LVAVVANIGISISLAIVAPGVFASLSLGLPPRARAVGFSVGALYALPGAFVMLFVGSIGEVFGIEWGLAVMTPVFVIGGLVIASAHRLLPGDVADVWNATAARSELLVERRAGRSPLLMVRKLDVAYGDVQILFDVDFEVDEGEVVALLGTNGAGKSTLLKAICGVVEADRGAVIFDGRDVTHAPSYEIAAMGVAQVPGGQGVFPGLTVQENLRAATWLCRRDTSLAGARIDEVLGTFPVLRDRLDDPAANLSGGQQQMLALGMAFIARPRLLLIDELSLGLAPVVVEQLVDIVRRTARAGTTVIVVEQSVNVALTLAEKAYFMEKGEIRFSGPTSELLDRPDVLRSVFLEGAGRTLAGAGAGAGEGDGQRRSGAGPRSAPVERGSTTGGSLDGAQAAGAALEVRGLWVRFGGIRAVDDVSFTVAPGEIVGLIGPNGAGKTTLLDLISGFTSAGGGAVVLGGRDVTGLSADARARHGLGRSFQDARLFPALTVEETIKVALERWVGVRDPFNAVLRLPAQQDAEAAAQWYADRLIDLLGIESFRTKFVAELSTGSRRVVDLACVLAHRPSVVLLDEPSSGIAQRETEALGPLLLRIRSIRVGS
jgi:branched-chain amino acid transport system ATP-binding protein